MTTVIPSTTVTIGARHRTAVNQLCRIETARWTRCSSIWLGLAGTVLFAGSAARADRGWSAEKYESMVPLTIIPLMIGAFVAGVRTGNRDRSIDRPPLAEEAPLDSEDRGWARLFGILVPVGMAASVMTVIGISSRVEGGYWIGEGPRRTDSATHSVFELAQPLLIVAATAAAGVAIGRAVRRPGPSVVVGMVVLFLTGGFYWAWNAPVIHAVALIQTQPLRVDLPVGTDPTALRADWLVKYPDEYDGWQRMLVHTPTVMLHDLYLAAFVVLFCGLTLRRRPRRYLVIGGSSLAIVAAVAQLVVSPRW